LEFVVKIWINNEQAVFPVKSREIFRFNFFGEEFGALTGVIFVFHFFYCGQENRLPTTKKKKSIILLCWLTLKK